MYSYHSSSKLHRYARRRIKVNRDGLSMRSLARQFDVSVATVHKWSHRDEDDAVDRSSRPLRSICAFTAEQEQIILHLRIKGQLSLDDLWDAAEVIVPNASRSSIYRLLKRNGQQRLPKAKDDQPDGAFDESILPGFLHIDSFMLTCLEGQSKKQSDRQHCFVAVDRATRMVFMRIYNSCGSDSACDFLRQCRVFFAFAIHTILTDNGAQYTFKWTAPPLHKAGRTRPFEDLCESYGVEHRTTRPYTPKTNGMVERVNGIVQQAITMRFRYTDPVKRDQAVYGWLIHYLFTRKHRRISIGRMTPFQAACRYYETHPELFAGRPEQDTILNQICSPSPGT